MSGTKPTAPKTPRLSSDEVCRILMACAEAQVTELEFSDLRVKRDRTVAQAHPETPTPSLPEATAEAATQIGRESLKVDVIQLREDQLAELAISNPMEYERLLASGELEHGAETRGSGEQLQ